MGNYIAVDIGGSFIKYGIISASGEVLKRQETSTEASLGASHFIRKVTGVIELLSEQESDIEGIGISTAGVVDTEQGIIVFANENLPGYTGTKVKQIIEKQFNLPTIVNNDVNAMALAEHWIGAGVGRKNFFCMTLGTGIGGAVILDGQLYQGGHFRAAEIGYLNYKGGEAYFEKQASTGALINKVKKELQTDEDVDGFGIFAKIKAGEPVYCNIFAAWIEELCQGIANIIYMFDPEMIIIGGGVSRQKNFLLGKIKHSLSHYLPPAFVNGIELEVAKCGNDAGLIGAVYGLVKNKTNWM
jgi:glucokinase